MGEGMYLRGEKIYVFFYFPFNFAKKITINKLVLKSKVLETVMVALHGECNDATKLCM